MVIVVIVGNQQHVQCGLLQVAEQLSFSIDGDLSMWYLADRFTLLQFENKITLDFLGFLPGLVINQKTTTA